MNIFLSYATEQKDQAELIAVALRDRGHMVFFSKDTLPAAATFDLRIEQAVAAADLLIFLLSPQSVARGKYTLTELGFARQKWKNPSGHILPVLVEKTPIETIPSYLRAVGILEPEGNLAADTASRVDKILVKHNRSRLALVAAAGLVSGVLSYYTLPYLHYLQFSIFYVSVPHKTEDIGPANIGPGVIFGVLVAGCNWIYGLRDKVLVVALVVFTTIAWVLAYDSTMTIYNALHEYQKTVVVKATDSDKSDSTSDPSDSKTGFKIVRPLQDTTQEYVPMRGGIAGIVGGFVGGIVTVFGVAVANRRFRRIQDMLPTIVAATVLGGLVELIFAFGDSPVGFLVVFVCWQIAVIVLIAHALATSEAEAG